MSAPFAPLIAAVLLQGPPSIPPEAVRISVAFFTMIASIALGIPLIRAFTKRIERGPSAPPTVSPDVTARLERIEQAVDAVAIEVERIAEAQRFVAKIMAEQSKRNLPGGEAPK